MQAGKPHGLPRRPATGLATGMHDERTPARLLLQQPNAGSCYCTITSVLLCFMGCQTVNEPAAGGRDEPLDRHRSVRVRHSWRVEANIPERPRPARTGEVDAQCLQLARERTTTARLSLPVRSWHARTAPDPPRLLLCDCVSMNRPGRESKEIFLACLSMRSSLYGVGFETSHESSLARQLRKPWSTTLFTYSYTFAFFFCTPG